MKPLLGLLMLVTSRCIFAAILPRREVASVLFDKVRSSSVPRSDNPVSSVNITEEFFTTSVDHFNHQEQTIWSNRYLSSMDYFDPTGPLLIFLAGDAPLASSMIDESTLINEMARDLGGAVFALETRFYGKSLPTEDLSVENLRLLNTDQILADVADFVIHLRRTVGNPFAHVLMVGTGLGGGLATWFRVRYPHLSDAVWSSSGFVRAVYDFQDFSYGWANTAIDFGSQECYNRIFIAFHVAQNLIDAGLERLMYEKFNICDPLDPDDHIQVAYFFSVLMTSIEVYTLRNGNIGDFGTVCQVITANTFDTSLDAFAYWFNQRFEEDNGCVIVDVDVVAETFRETLPTDASNFSGARQFLYQQCTEYGWFFTTDSDLQPFGERVQMDLYNELCRRAFGDWITPEFMYDATVRTNNRFGGSSPNIMQVHFTNGAQDPWRYTSVLEDLNPYALSDLIPRKLAGTDLTATSVENDSVELLEVKRRLKEILEGYLFPFNPR